jgi:hypothetical protein
MQCDKTLTSKPGRRRPRQHWVQAALASVFVVGQLLGTLHFALVEHVVCLEHGEIAHAGRVQEPSDWVAFSPPASIARLETGRSGSYATVEDHRHCLVQALRRDSATRTKVPAPMATEGLCALDHPLTATRPSEESALFRLAPKHSPPL